MQRLWIRETLYVLFVPTQIHTWSKAPNQYYLFMLSHSVDRKINLIIYEDTCYFNCFVCTDGLTHTHSYNKINGEKRYEQTTKTKPYASTPCTLSIIKPASVTVWPGLLVGSGSQLILGFGYPVALQGSNIVLSLYVCNSGKPVDGDNGVLLVYSGNPEI